MNLIQLDAVVHKNVKIHQGYGHQFGDHVHYVPVIADELKNLVCEYPVCFMKNPNNGQFELVAILGFQAGQNLYLNEEQWRTNYIPLHFRRQPFMFSSQAENETQLIFDQTSKRVNSKDGLALFDEKGNETAYLLSIKKILSTLASGSYSTSLMIKALIEHDIIEPIRIKVTLTEASDTDNVNYIDGLYSINEQKLGQLKDSLLIDFISKGYLQACAYLGASLGHLDKLNKWNQVR